MNIIVIDCGLAAAKGEDLGNTHIQHPQIETRDCAIPRWKQEGKEVQGKYTLKSFRIYLVIL